MPGQHFRPPLPVGPRPQMVPGQQVQPGSENRTQMLLQQRQPPPNSLENQVSQVTASRLQELGNISLQILFLREIHQPQPAPAISLKATLATSV